MKKLLLTILVIAGLSQVEAAQNSKQPNHVMTVSVYKYNGGIGMLFNLYNHVLYQVDRSTLSGVPSHASLICSGNGLTSCRVPSGGTGNNFFYGAIPATQFIAIVNQLVAASEDEIKKGVLSGRKSIKLSVLENGKNMLYYFTAQWSPMDPQGINNRIEVEVVKSDTPLY